MKFTSTAYKSKVFDRIETNAAYSEHENKLIDINQEGIENELIFRKKDKKLSIFSNFTKSRKDNGQAQSRRPDLSYGANYSKKIETDSYGPFTFNLNYKYTGKFVDWDGVQIQTKKHRFSRYIIKKEIGTEMLFL